MRRTVHAWLAGLMAATLSVGMLTMAVEGPAAAAGASPKTIRAAVDATRAARAIDYVADITVNGTRISAAGLVDLANDRTAVDVTVGDVSSEFRRIGDVYYVEARQLGSKDSRWVSLNSARSSQQMSVRSVAGLVAAVSPQVMLAVLETATAVTKLGSDSSGTHYRVVPGRSAPGIIPLADAFGELPAGVGAATQVDVWVDARGRVSRVDASTQAVTTRFTLRRHGSSAEISAPPSAATGDLRSPSGTYLFGNGMTVPRKPATQPQLTVDPTIEMADGIVRGRLGATSSTQQQMAYEFVSSSKGGKVTIGNVPNGQGGTAPQSFTILPYADWLDGRPKGSEAFGLRVREVTAVNRYLARIPLIGLVASPVIDLLQELPQTTSRLAYAIGASKSVLLDVDVSALAPSDTPLAFTFKVRGYRGDAISMNFFPASGLAAGDTASVVLQGSALGEAGNTDPYQVYDTESATPGTKLLRNPVGVGAAALNVITWDPRGSYASDGTVQVNNPFYDAVDVREIISWAAANPLVTLNGFGDPAVGMVGGSSGGELQLITGATDPRVDAIVPAKTWNSLIDSLQPNGVLNTAVASRFLATLDKPEVRLNPQLRAGLTNGISSGRLSEATLDLLATKNASTLLSQLQAPTLLFQDTADPLFPLDQPLASAQTILGNPYGTPVKIGWFNGSANRTDALQVMADYSRAWLYKYVVGVPIPDSYFPEFQWWDQVGVRYTSTLYPFDPGFNTPSPLSASSAGGSIDLGSSSSAIRMRVPVTPGTQIVGAPSLSFTYSGTGDARGIGVRVVDASTGTTVGSAANLLPVVLDGRSRTVSVQLGDIAFTGQPSSALQVTLSGARGALATPGSGRVRVSNVVVSFPRRSIPG